MSAGKDKETKARQARLLRQLAGRLEQYQQGKEAASHDAAVLIPLVQGESGFEVLLELRAKTLHVQPGEVCFPGGSVEPGERPQEAAIREACEELCISASQIEVVGSMGVEPGPGGRTLHVFVGVINRYAGTFSPSEVDHTFTLPLEWLSAHPPRLFKVSLHPQYPDDFPWELVPGGKEYAWSPQVQLIPFYFGTGPVVWGATARVLERFVELATGE